MSEGNLIDKRVHRRAFTLVELLVVIAIIGLLTTVAVVATSSARSRARDVKRLADFRQIRTALDLYYDANGFYPQCGGQNGCTTNGGYNDLATLDINPTYMTNIPKDPLNVATQYGYYYARGYKKTGACAYAAGSTTDYMLATKLENPNNVDGSCPGGFTGWNSATYALNFLVGN